LHHKDNTWSKAILTTLSIAAIYFVMVEPSFAANIDLSPVTEFIQSIVTALTGTLGLTAATLAFIACFITWFFGIIDFRQLIWVVIAIVGIGSAATIVKSLWTGAA
jgi:type IV secretion system protein VirB2